MARVDLSESDEQLVSQYIGGLQTQIQDTLNIFDPNTVLKAYQRALLIEKTSVRGSLDTFGRRGSGSYNCLGGSFANRGSTPPNGPNKMTTTTGQPSRTETTTGLECFHYGEPGHRITDCHKGEKYDKGLLVDAEEAFEEQGNGVEQEVDFDGNRGTKEEFVTGDDE